LNVPAVTSVAQPTSGQIVYSLESRKSLELDLADLVIDGQLQIFPHIEEKGLLFLSFRRKRLILSAGAFIGLIPLTPQISIDVRPKLPVSNLAKVLNAAGSSLSSIAGVDRLYLVNNAAESSVLDFLAANLLDSLQSISISGIHKEYVDQTEITGHPSGRIEIAGTMHAWSRGQFHKVQARRFSQSSDIPVNRLVRGALHFVLQRIRPVSEGGTGLIGRLNAAYLEMPNMIGPLRAADYEECKTILRTRSLPSLRAYYYRPIEIALLILSNQGVALQEHGYDILLETFIVNFEDLFETYVRRILQQQATADLWVRNGNLEAKKSLFDDKRDPPAQPDIVLTWRPTNRKVIAEVKYKERPDRQDINQVITYALCYGTDCAMLIHQCKPGSPKGLMPIGTIRGIRVEAYGFDLGATDLDAEEKAFADCLFGLVRATSVTDFAA
jgi:5-methylcytosine-specific restriction enzyme subunit McrC